MLCVVEYKVYWISNAAGLDIHTALAEMHRFLFISALFHCTVSVLMTLNTMYVSFISVIPFYLHIGFKFSKFYFNFSLIFALCLGLKYKLPIILRIHNVVHYHLCIYNS